MRKRIVSNDFAGRDQPEDQWLNVASLAQVEITSEEAGAEIELALGGQAADHGWRSATSGEQIIRLHFDQPQQVQRVALRFVEHETERTQEFVLRWSSDGQTYQDIVRQRWNFSPRGATEEREDYDVNLNGVRNLELRIVPDVTGGEARATLAHLRVL
jgi:hypothetical protein